MRSIHVTGEGEGSKATLIAWLKRRAAQQYGQKVVGQHVWVCWCADATYYKGLITHYSPETGKHKVSRACLAAEANSPSASPCSAEGIVQVTSVLLSC